MISIIIASRDGTVPNLQLEGNYEVLSVTGGNHVSEARNKGASSAKGDILLFDDDDINLSGNLYGLGTRVLFGGFQLTSMELWMLIPL